MDWTPLAPLVACDWHARATAKRRDELNARVAKLLETRALMDQHAAKLLESPLADVQPDDLFQLDMPSLNRFEALRTELALRTDLADWYAREEQDCRTAHAAAIDAHAAAEADVRARLVSIGYVDVPPTEPIIGRIQPLFVMSHPAVNAARQQRDALASYGREPSQANEQARENVTAELDRLRRRAVTSGQR